MLHDSPMKFSKLNSSVRLLLRGVPASARKGQRRPLFIRSGSTKLTRQQHAVVDGETLESVPQVASRAALQTLTLVDDAAIPALHIAEDVNVLLERLVGSEHDVCGSEWSVSEHFRLARRERAHES